MRASTALLMGTQGLRSNVFVLRRSAPSDCSRERRRVLRGTEFLAKTLGVRRANLTSNLELIAQRSATD